MQFEGFDDFTLASSWERFISEIEAVCRLWLADGPKNLLEKGAISLDTPKKLYKVKFEMKYGMKNYLMEYFFEANNEGDSVDWNDDLHDLQLSFGVKKFLVIAPISASGVVLDAPEASKLLSAVSIALSNCGSTWPAFVPVHDPSRKAYIGIQNMGTVFTRRFEADRIGSQVPVRLMHLEGLYELFVSKFSFFMVDVSTYLFQVNFTMRLTYRTPPHDEDDVTPEADPETAESAADPDVDTRGKTQWDDDCPWTEWYSAEDPVKGFELITIWSNKVVENSLQMAELENVSSDEAEKWFIVPILSPNITDEPKGNTVGFASQLRLLVNALDASFEAQFMEDFVSAENSASDNLNSSLTIPPPTVLDRVLKDLFHEDIGAQSSDYIKGEHKNSRVIKGAPLESLFAQFCLNCLWFGNCNIRAIAVLWIEFVREVRWFWEESQPLPRMPTNGVIDLSTCLIHQKLQMLSICIEKRSRLNQSNQDHASDHIEEDGKVAAGPTQMRALTEEFDLKHDSSLRRDGSDSSVQRSCIEPGNAVGSACPQPDQIRRGSSGVVGSMMLLNSHQMMHAPSTQDPPIMTEDMHEERLRAVEALGGAFSFSAQLERDILSSDMSAFKAANPDAVFEDFIRWHSPGDWENEEIEEKRTSGERLTDGWPPRGRLSERMSENGNSWRQIWNEAPPLPASEQKPLLDPDREGEKVLHYLETLRPHQLLEQMVSTAFKASADTLSQTSFGGLKQMTTRMDQLYLTIASILKPLQANVMPEKVEMVGDLRRLCVIFEHVEKLLILAASMHRRLSQAPRLSETIFADCYSYYSPRMGAGELGSNIQKEFNMKQQVRRYERRVVENMFTPPTANQSWRKVLSMGNLLNGHEPVVREIIFFIQDSMSHDHYADRRSPHEDIETHRMYICGTSNDLRVAHSVTSCD
ncbi:rab3 GTPase-activating protein catalytic subunit isoform X2 [Telopea speciosissima]|uniref:rab3 GTPase-activating protein catalytic subunit isoform X2 n=1 Tax=Telopea speciosissima TaxID=54955 RepID=UPI001CC56679|nr:rab3 GTPase-activating protein catalytic subunit isoform X2 [Telopea speciosissima]